MSDRLSCVLLFIIGVHEVHLEWNVKLHRHVGSMHVKSELKCANRKFLMPKLFADRVLPLLCETAHNSLHMFT